MTETFFRLATGRVAVDAKQELLHHFLAVARQAGITHISEGGSIDAWAKCMGAE